MLPVASERDVELMEVDALAAAGCSVCARALVNAREAAVDLALIERPAAPRAPLARRVLESARRARASRAGHDERVADAEASAAQRAPLPPINLATIRALDASGAIAHLHIGGPGDAERIAEVDDLAAGEPAPGEATQRILEHVGRLLAFPINFVSVVRGERVGYRVQRGLNLELKAFREMRREMTYCTHCVSSGAPFIVQNAATEPFFRGSKMVHRYLVNAYVGVPLVTSRGVTIGTLCALDFGARFIGPELVRTLELFTRPVLAEIERARDPSARAAILEESPRGGWLYRAAWFAELCEVELAHVRASRDDRGHDPAHRSESALISVRGPAAAALPSLARDDEPAGRLGDDAVGLLLPGAGAAVAEARCAELRASLAALDLEGSVGFSVADAAGEGAPAFVGRAAERA